jgi:uroporphyrinogen-III synthase
MNDAADGRPLAGRRIALPETREALRLSMLLAEQGAEIVGCPLVGIVDTADPAAVEAWLAEFVAAPFDDLVLLTGEGLDRLHGVARRLGIEPDFLAALGRTRTVTRGPKPARVLRELGLRPGLRAEPATSEGIVALLSAHALRGRRVGVQLYPGAGDRLADFLREAGATPFPVTPYAYVAHADDERVAALIDRMAAGGIDAIAFTSASQVSRLFSAALATGREEPLRAALRRIVVAAVGPVATAELRRRAANATVATPGKSFSMKPLVSAVIAAMQKLAAVP